MTLIQHTDFRVRYQQQVDNARDYMVPFIEQALQIHQDMEILEIGCGEGGVLVPFLERGCNVVGIELDATKSGYARELLSSFMAKGRAELVNCNIYDAEALDSYNGRFDLIILKDVVEHIPDQARFIPYLQRFLRPQGHLFFGFPPWCMPHGGHQQVCDNRLLSVLPWFHLLPAPLYRSVLRLFGEREAVVTELLEIKTTGLSTRRFERLARQSGYRISLRTFFLINPIYRYKFGWNPREQYRWVARLPWVRDFITTCAWYLVQRGQPV
ncbi:MAG: class I SAM-dependent methyltransferase [Bacteroidetes bacterium]|nr:class I SAM-dependent methyltransferase [Bacteroidota bacterium]